LPKATSPNVPEYVPLVSLASGINLKRSSERSQPKKPTCAEVSYHWNAIPLSRPSLTVGVESPPRLNTGSSIETVVELMIVCTPLTVKLPSITTEPSEPDGFGSM
jgi:hypothetical protein